MMNTDLIQTAQAAINARQTLSAANKNGEIKGYGPPWACANYAEAGHVYIRCRRCYSNFEAHLGAKEAA